MVFTETELAYLASQPLGRIASQQPNGTLQVSPVGFRVDPQTGVVEIHGYRMAQSRKYRNIAANGRVAFVVDDLASVRPWRPRCVEIRGRGEATTDADGHPVILIIPERVISFGLDEPDAPADDLTVDSRSE